jgi:hypothetical protein
MNVNPQLAALIGHLALTARILLLLAGLLTAALLLAGLLTRGLVLLTRILVRIAHSDTPLFGLHGEITGPGSIGCGEQRCSLAIIPGQSSDRIMTGEPCSESSSAQAL